MATNYPGLTETEFAASETKSGWNPFAPFKREGLPKPVQPAGDAPESLPMQPIAEEPATDAERQRIARAWNGLQLPL